MFDTQLSNLILGTLWSMYPANEFLGSCLQMKQISSLLLLLFASLLLLGCFHQILIIVLYFGFGRLMNELHFPSIKEKRPHIYKGTAINWTIPGCKANTILVPLVWTIPDFFFFFRFDGQGIPNQITRTSIIFLSGSFKDQRHPCQDQGIHKYFSLAAWPQEVAKFCPQNRCLGLQLIYFAT